MSKIFTIASGSSGNCTFIGCGNNGILVDAGVSAKAITEGLTEIAFDPKNLSAIFVTHEHTDHINGLRVFSKKYNIPVFGSPETLNEVTCCTGMEEDLLNPFETTVEVDNMKITRFATSHDCAGSSGYTVVLPDGKKCAVCTDLGFVSEEVRQALKGSAAIVFESNHDVNLLHKGTYPEHLKRRILSDKGHLSNNACAVELPKLVENGTTRIILGHLSRENNRPEIARNSAVAALMDNRMKENDDYLLYIAPPKLGKAVLF